MNSRKERENDILMNTNDLVFASEWKWVELCFKAYLNAADTEIGGHLTSKSVFVGMFSAVALRFHFQFSGCIMTIFKYQNEQNNFGSRMDWIFSLLVFQILNSYIIEQYFALDLRILLKKTHTDILKPNHFRLRNRAIHYSQ